MKKNYLLLLIAALLLVIPFNVSAGTKKVLDKDYTTMSFKEALEQEGIDVPKGLTENDDQITVYLFRGHGCGFCKAFLTFMSNIYGEYGKYFKIVSFEVWENEDNWYLMNQIAVLKDQKPAEGVPYILIGDKVFGGYADVYDEEIKEAIKNLYNTKKSDRYDVFKVAESEGLISVEDMLAQYGQSGEEETTSSSKSGNCNELLIILCTLGFVAVGTAAVIIFNNYKFNKIQSVIEESNNKIKSFIESSKPTKTVVKETKTAKTKKK